MVILQNSDKKEGYIKPVPPSLFFQTYFTFLFLLWEKLFYVVDGKPWLLYTFAMKFNKWIILWSV